MAQLTNAQMGPIVAHVALEAVKYMGTEEEFYGVSEAWPGSHFLAAVLNARRIRQFPERLDETKLPSYDDEQLWLLESIKAGEPAIRPGWMDDERHAELVDLLEGGAESVLDELCRVTIPVWDD